jgi:hypothetical protein
MTSREHCSDELSNYQLLNNITSLLLIISSLDMKLLLPNSMVKKSKAVPLHAMEALGGEEV